MANTIQLRKQYATMLDLVYKKASLTSILDGPTELIKEGANANEILIPKLDMQGLANYSRSSGYVNGDVTLEYETKKCAYDRGRMFNVDSMDNIETAGIAFGSLSGEFLRTKVVPELDAWRFAEYAGKATNKATGSLADGKAALAALRVCKNHIKNSEANPATCYLFIDPTVLGSIEDLDTTASRKALEGWAGIIEVPENRFNTKITLNPDGAGGFTAAGSHINFMAIDKQTAMQYQKHTVSKIISPEDNQQADAWRFGYRTVGMAEVLDNKMDGLYVHSVE